MTADTLEPAIAGGLILATFAVALVGAVVGRRRDQPRPAPWSPPGAGWGVGSSRPASRWNGRPPLLPTNIVSENFCAGQDAYCCTHGADHRTSVRAIESRVGVSTDLVVTSASTVKAA